MPSSDVDFFQFYCAVPLIKVNSSTVQLFNLVKITFLLIHAVYNVILISIDSTKFAVHWQIIDRKPLFNIVFATFEQVHRGSWESDA